MDQNVFLLLFPIAIIFIIYSITYYFKDKNNKEDLISYKGFAETTVSKDNGIVTIIYEGMPKILIAASYKGIINVGAPILVVQYDEDRKIYMVEPYVWRKKNNKNSRKYILIFVKGS